MSPQTLDYLLVGEAVCLSKVESYVQKTDKGIHCEEDEHWIGI